MNGKTAQSFMAKTSLDKFNILVVDDDPTSLSIVSAMLKSWKYEVATVKSPVDALSTIRTQHERIDLVLTDLHMPQMNGIELQKQINEEFNKLPVVIMSSDDRESVILKSLAGGAVFYIVKPVNPSDLKNVWQYAVASKKGKSTLIEEIGSIQFGASSAERISYTEDIISASSVNEEKQDNKKNSKRKALKKGKEYLAENSVAPKKAKVVWTNSLHNRFLQAIKHISLEKAVPKKILECMNVPGLTRENVASHLQKYRIFLKRVAEKGARASTKNFSRRNLTSSFAASGQSSLILKRAQQDHQQFKGKQPTRNACLPGYGDNILPVNVTNCGSRHGASSSNSDSQRGLLGNQANLPQAIFGNTNPLHQANRSIFGIGSSSFETNLFSRGGMSDSPISGTNSMQVYHQHSLARPDVNFGTLGNWKPNCTPGKEKMGTFNSPYTNYTEMRITDDMEFAGIGQSTLSGNGLNGGYGLTNPAQNHNVNIGPMGIPTFGYLAPGESSSAGFDGANYQFSPAFASVNEQGNSSELPFTFDGQNNFAFDLINNASACGNIAHPQQFGEGNISRILFGTTNYPFAYQQQGGEGVPHLNFPSSSHLAEVNLPESLSLNPDFSSALTGVKDNDPWIKEPSLEQLQDIEEAMIPDSDNANHILHDYFPDSDQNPDQQEGNQDSVSCEIYNLLMDDTSSGKQDWVEEFLNSLLGDRPF